MHLVKENDVYKRERAKQFTNEETITFFLPEPRVYEKWAYDWYMAVALEKVDKVTVDRHLLTGELIIQYRYAIREGYNHGIDPDLQRDYDHPRNRNTVKGIQSYINRIQGIQDKLMAEL